MKQLLILVVLLFVVSACRDDAAVGRATALSAVAAAQAEAGDLEASRESVALALETLRLAQAEDDTRALMAVAWAQAKAGDLEDALNTADGIESVEDRAVALSQLAALRARAGDRAGAAETLALALEAVAWSDDPGNHLELIMTQALLGDPEGAVGMARSITQAETRILVLAAVAALQAQAGDLWGVEETLSLTGETVAVLAVDSAESDPELLIYDVVAAWLWALAGDSAGALDAASDIADATWSLEDAELRSMLLVGAAAAQIRAGDMAAAERTTAMLRTAAEDASYAERVLVFGSVALLQALAGDSMAAIDTVDVILDPSQRAATLVVLAAARAAAGDAAGAGEFMTLALQAVDTVDDSGRWDGLLIMAARVQLMMGDAPGARDTLDRVEDSLGTCETIPAGMMGRIAAGDIAGAGWDYLDWRPYCDYQGDTSGVVVAVLQARAGDAWTARETAGSARQAAVKVTDARDHDRLLAWAAEIEDDTDDKDISQAEATEIAGPDSDLALDPAYAQILENPYERARALSAMARTLAAEGRIAEAAAMVGPALEASQGLWDTTLRTLALAAVAEAQAATGDPGGAGQSLALALTAAESVTAPYYRAAALLTIAEAQAAMGDRTAARHTAGTARAAALQIAVAE